MERNPLLKAAGGRHFFALPMVSTWFLEEEPTRLLEACKNSRNPKMSGAFSEKMSWEFQGFYRWLKETADRAVSQILQMCYEQHHDMLRDQISMHIRACHCHSVGAWLGSKSKGIVHNKATAGTSLPNICPRSAHRNSELWGSLGISTSQELPWTSSPHVQRSPGCCSMGFLFQNL